jgi:hypothetical protein
MGVTRNTYRILVGKRLEVREGNGWIIPSWSKKKLLWNITLSFPLDHTLVQLDSVLTPYLSEIHFSIVTHLYLGKDKVATSKVKGKVVPVL